jgi:hypothetical protein
LNREFKINTEVPGAYPKILEYAGHFELKSGFSPCISSQESPYHLILPISSVVDL